MTDRPSTSFPLRADRLLLPLVGALVLSSCGEWALAGPEVDLVTEETHAALEGAEKAPSIDDLASAAGLEGELGGAPDEWRRSWNHEGGEGRSMRARAYDRAVPALAASMERAEVEEALDALAEVLVEADRVETDRLPGHLRSELERARDLEGHAEETLERDGDREEVLRSVLEAGDALRVLSPRAVAREMIRVAARSMEEARARDGEDVTRSDGAYMPPDDLERAERLVRGADRAFERGDHRRAIQRAFYAHQIAENGGTR